MSFSFKSKAGVDVEVWGHNDTKDGNPAGGHAASPSARVGELHDMLYGPHPTHFVIRWQDGPVDREAGEQPNGTFVEDVLEVCAERLRFYQASQFKCRENESALALVESAIEELVARRTDRRERGVEGEHKA